MTSAKIACVANSKVGRTDWSYESSTTGYGANTNKCNYFVYDIGIEAGAKMPTRPWRWFRPVGAGEGGWGKATTLDYWSRVTSPQAGDIIAGYGCRYNAYHVGIYVDSQNVVSANSEDIGKNNKMLTNEYQDVVFWRYTG